MNTAQNPATTVLCLCDPVAPAFLFDGEQSNNYYPENVIGDVQGMGYDSTGQSYGPNADGSGSLGCPKPDVGCEYDLAFGLLADGPQQPQDNDEGVRIYHAGGGQDPIPVTGITATSLAQQWVMMANLIENTGPHLDPINMHNLAPRMGTVGGGATGQPLMGFLRQPTGDINYNMMLDQRIVYWSRNKVSPYNGKPGSYVSIEGNRYDLGQYGSLPDGPPIPAQR